jgi:hypothetical protein
VALVISFCPLIFSLLIFSLGCLRATPESELVMLASMDKGRSGEPGYYHLLSNVRARSYILRSFDRCGFREFYGQISRT